MNKIILATALAIVLGLAAGLNTTKTCYVWTTAYTSHRNQTDSTPFINARGLRCRIGDVACNFLPFGSKVRITGLPGVFVVNDRMKHTNRLDVYMGTDLNKARQFGRKYLAIEILNLTF